MGVQADHEMMRELGELLANDRSDALRKEWARRIAEKRNLMELVGLLDAEHPVAMRFSWIFGDITDLNPELIFDCLPYFFKRRNDFTFPGFQRSVARMLYFAGVPEELEGEVTDQLVEWVMDPQQAIGVKHHSLKVLIGLAKKYPELAQEVILVMESQADMHTAAYQKRTRKWKAELESWARKRSF